MSLILLLFQYLCAACICRCAYLIGRFATQRVWSEGMVQWHDFLRAGLKDGSLDPATIMVVIDQIGAISDRAHADLCKHAEVRWAERRFERQEMRKQIEEVTRAPTDARP